eukprot:10260484-Alexandrium_andersonii.AAC.1
MSPWLWRAQAGDVRRATRVEAQQVQLRGKRGGFPRGERAEFGDKFSQQNKATSPAIGPAKFATRK